MATIGEAGDTVQFTEYISKNLVLYKMRNGYELTPKAAAHFTRKNLAEYLRSRTPYHVNLFVAGFDEKEGPELHYIDYLSNALSVNYAGHGYGGMFCASIFDRYHHPSKLTIEVANQKKNTSLDQTCSHFVSEITQEEAYDVFKKCILEIQKRLIVNLANFKIAVVDKNGIRYLDDITSKTLIDYKP